MIFGLHRRRVKRNMDFLEVRNLADARDVAVVVATEVPPDAPLAEFHAVISVIHNRARLWGLSPITVVLKRKQFSAVYLSQISDAHDHWIRAMAGDWEPEHVERCYKLLNEVWRDTTGGATDYYSPISMEPPHSLPRWDWSELEEVHVEGVRPEYFRFFRRVSKT